MVTDPLDASSADEIETSPSTKKINVVSSSSSYDVDNRKMKAKDDDVGVVVTSPSGHDVIKLNVPGINASSTRNEQPKGKLLPHERISKFAKVSNVPKSQSFEWITKCHFYVCSYHGNDVVPALF